MLASDDGHALQSGGRTAQGVNERSELRRSRPGILGVRACVVSVRFGFASRHPTQVLLRQLWETRLVDNGPVCSVIIVSFNSGALLTDCVASVLASTLPVEVLVSDNGSIDGSLDALRAPELAEGRVRIVENGTNLGFAAAANRVLPLAQGDWVLFLNPDCLLQPDTLERMLAVLDGRPDVGIAGPLILGTDGQEQAGCRRREPTPIRSLARVFHLQRWLPQGAGVSDFNMAGDPLPAAPVAVDAISGAFMLVEREAMRRVGPLDDGYFLHCEDLDWCRRFRDAGFIVLFVPSVEIVHHKGTSSKMRPIRVEWHKHRGMLRYYRKFFGESYPLPLWWGVRMFVWVRFGALALVLAMRRLLG